MVESLIRVENLHYTYGTPGEAAIVALCGVSLEIAPGEYVAIVGHNGSGKSTLAKCLNGLLTPTIGEVWVGEQNTRAALSRLAIRAQVGMVLQNPDNQIISTVVEDEVAFGPENLGVPRPALAQRVELALRDTGLAAARDRDPRTLSAGEKARLAIASMLALLRPAPGEAQGLATHPRCLVLDEATAMLDPLARGEMLALLRRLQGEGLAIVIVTHFMDEAIRADQVFVLEQGQVALRGTPRQVFAAPDRLTALGLELPPAAALAAALRARGLPLEEGLLTVEELVPALRALARREVHAAQAEAERRTPPLAAGEPLATLCALHHTYLPGTLMATTALRGADLTVARGEISALIGPSGAGKSTLVRYLNGLLRPTASGQVVVGGQDTAAPGDLAALRRRVGLVFQQPQQQLFERYVGDDVAYGPRQLGLQGAALRERVAWAMGLVGLDFAAFVDRYTFTLSGGEMRRVALAGVLAMRPEMLVLDEATTGLDPRGRREVHALLRRLREEWGTTVLFISNDMDEVAALAERVTLLDQGRTVCAGAMREVLGDGELLRAHGLASPTVNQLADALRAGGLTALSTPFTVSETEEALWPLLAR